MGPLGRSGRVFEPGGEVQRMLYEQSGGRIQLNIIPRMFSPMELFKAVQEGKADMSDIPMPWMSGTYPLWNWEKIPGLTSYDYIQGIEEGHAIWQSPKLAEIWDETYREVGLVHWFNTEWHGASTVWSKTPVTTLEQWRGLKTGGEGYLEVIALKALGISVVDVHGPEMPQAMLTGVVDATLIDIPFAYAIGTADVSKYATAVPFTSLWTTQVVMNAEKYDALPPDLQRVLRNVGREVEQMTVLSIQAEVIMTMEAMKVKGIELLHLEEADNAEMIELLKPMRDEWLKIAGPYGPEVLAIIEEEIAEHRAFETHPE